MVLCLKNEKLIARAGEICDLFVDVHGYVVGRFPLWAAIKVFNKISFFFFLPTARATKYC